MIIYKIENKINGKVYIGQTIRNLNKRIGLHLIAKSLVGNALRKYALQSFYVSIIDFADTKAILDEKEKEYIRLYNCKAPNGYNLTDGGHGMSGVVDLRHSEEWNSKISNSLGCIGRIPWNKGIPCSNETKEKISRANMGKPSPWKGMHPSKETIEKSRQTHLGKHFSEETRIKMSKAHKGKRLSEEHKNKISITRKQLFKENKLKGFQKKII